MPKVERKLDIKAPAKTIFDILDDTSSLPIWSLPVKEIKQIGPDKFEAKTTVGDTISTRTETVPNKKITTKQEGGPMKTLGYILKPKGDLTEATIWAEYDDPGQENILGIAGEVFLKSLKKYAEYLEVGGKPEDFKKK